jgi:hypothetical protein
VTIKIAPSHAVAVGAAASNGTRLFKLSGLAARQHFQSKWSALHSAVDRAHRRPDVTAVLAAVKVVRPTGRSTIDRPPVFSELATLLGRCSTSSST